MPRILSPEDYAARYEGFTVEAEPRGALSAGLSSGVDQLQSLGYGVLSSGLDALSFDNVARRMQDRRKLNDAEAYYNGRPDLDRIEDVNLGNVGEFAAYQIAKQGPLIGAIAGAQAIPGVGQAATGLGLARLGAVVPRILGGGGLRAGADFAARRAALAAGESVGSSVLAGSAVGAGSLYNQSVDAGDPSPFSAFAVAPLYGALEAAVPSALRGALRAPANLTGGLARRMATAGGLGALGESGTELGQTELEMAFGPALSDEEAFSQRLNAGVIGGLVGGPIGSLGGIRRRRTVDEGQFDLTGNGNQAPAVNTPEYNLTTEMGPLQGRIDQNLGLQRTPLRDYEKQFLEAFNEPSGRFVSDPATGVERELTAGEVQQMQLGELKAQQEATTKREQQIAQETLLETSKALGVTPVATMDNTYDVLGARVYGQPQVAKLVQEVAVLNSQLPAEQQQLNAAILGANLVNFSGKTGIPTAQKIGNAINGKIKQLQLEGVESVERAAEILNDQVATLVAAGKNEGDVKLGQIAMIYERLTGQTPPALGSTTTAAPSSATPAATTPAATSAAPIAENQQPKFQRAPAPEGQTNVSRVATPAAPAAPSVVGRSPVVSGSVGNTGSDAAVDPRVGSDAGNPGAAGQQVSLLPDGGVQRPAAVTPEAQAWEGHKDDADGPLESLPANQQEIWRMAVAAKQQGKSINLFRVAEELGGASTVDPRMEVLQNVFGKRDGQIVFDVVGTGMSEEEAAAKYSMSRANIQKIAGATGRKTWGGKITVAKRKFGYTDNQLKAALAPTSSEATLGETEVESEIFGSPKGMFGGGKIDPLIAEEAGLSSIVNTAGGGKGNIGAKDMADFERYLAPLLRRRLELMSADQTPGVKAELAEVEAKIAEEVKRVTKIEKAVQADVRKSAGKVSSKEVKAEKEQRDSTKGKELSGTEADIELGGAKQAEKPAVDEQAVDEPVADFEKARDAWDKEALTYDDAPTFDDLTEDQQDRWVEYGPKNWKAADVAAELARIQKESPKFGKDIKDIRDVRAEDPYTAEELLAELKDFVRADIPGRKLMVVDSIEDLLRSADEIEQTVGAAIALENAYGVASNGRGYLIANRINKGSGRAKFMHEVGAHLGLENLLTKAQYKKLVQQIKSWADSDADTDEVTLANRATLRVLEAGTRAADRDSELLAYFIEEAIEGGIDPTSDAKMSGPLREWFRTLWAAFKVAVRKLGFKPESMTAQDVVNLAFGAARLEINGTFHGTAAAFRKFNNKFIGSGEGATAYGWGSYLAQRAGIAKGYFEDDVRRKGGKSEGNLMRVDTAVDDDLVFDYDKPISKQPKYVADKLMGLLEPHADEIVERTNLEIGELKGRDLFGTGEKDLGLLSSLIMDDAIAPTKADAQFEEAVSRGKFHEAASQLLRTMGIGGIKFYDSKSRGSATNAVYFEGRSYNLDELRDKVKKYRDTDPDKSMQFLTLVDVLRNGFDATKQALEAKVVSPPMRVSFEGRSYNRDELRDKVKEYSDTDPDKSRGFGVLRSVLRDGVRETKQSLEAKVAKVASMFEAVYADSAARYNVKADTAADRARAQEEAAATYDGKQLAWLNANESGIFLVQNPKTRNLVVFDDKNVFRAGSAVAADRQRMKFGKNTPGTGDVFRRSLDPVPNQFRGPVKDVLTAVKDASAKGLDYVVFTSDLVDRAIASGVKSAQTFRDLLVARATEVRKNEREVERIADMYALVPDKDRQGARSVNNFLFESTRQGKWGYDSGKFKADPAMAAWFNSLDTKSQAFVKAVYQHGNSVLAKKKQTVLKYTETEYDTRIAGETDPKAKAELEKDKKNSLKRFQSLFALREGLPYAPIKRSGSHVVVAMSAAYKAAKADGDTKLMEKLESDEANYQVTFTNSKWEARRLSERLAADPAYADGDVYLRERDKHQDMLYGGDGVLKSLAKLRTRVENSDDKSSAKMLRMVSDLYLEALAENSARKSELRRRGIAGDVDMVASFAQQGRADANFMASVQFGQPIQRSIQSMTNEVKDARDEGRASELRNELLARYEQTMDAQQTPWLNRLTRLSSIYWLATSPAYYMQNLTQPWMMSVPAMAGRHNWVAVNAAIFKAYGELKGVVSSGKAFKQNFDLTKVPGDVRDAIQELANRGKIDIGLESEMGEFSAQGQGKIADGVNKIDKGLRLAVQKVETINRLSTAMAAYRLEMGRTGDPKKALDYADRILTDTHGDYTGANAPRAFNSPVGKVALQFRKFQLIQLTYYAKLLNTIFTDPKERTAAMKMLGYSLGHTALFAGVRGLPGFAALAFVASKLLGDDDEPFDLEATMRNAIGDTDMANLIMRGAPTLAGLDISGKVGAGNMLSLLPFSNADLTTPQGRSQAAGELMLGAAGGMVSRMADGLGQVVSGDVYRGLESLLPKGLGDVLKAGRETTEGMTRRNGDLMLSPEEISYWETLWQGLGVQSAQKGVVYEQQQRVRNMDDRFQERTTRVKNDYAKAVRQKDTEAAAEARQAWTKLQEARVRNGYTKQPMSSLLKAPQEQSKRGKNTVNGVAFNKQNRGFVESQI